MEAVEYVTVCVSMNWHTSVCKLMHAWRMQRMQAYEAYGQAESMLCLSLVSV